MRHRQLRNSFQKLNLIPILDAVFIFIFFLLMSARFINLHEIGGQVPTVSDAPAEKMLKPPLAVTLRVKNEVIKVQTGLSSKTVLVLKRKGKGFDFKKLHQHLIGLKKKHPKEDTVVFEPDKNVKYKLLVRLMDQVRLYKNPKTNKEDKLFTKIVYVKPGGRS